MRRTRKSCEAMTQEEIEAALDMEGIPIYPENPWLLKIADRKHLVAFRPDEEMLKRLTLLGGPACSILMFLPSRIGLDGLSNYPLEELSTRLNQPVEVIDQAIDEIVELDLAQRKTDNEFWLNPKVFWAVN